MIWIDNDYNGILQLETSYSKQRSTTGLNCQIGLLDWISGFMCWIRLDWIGLHFSRITDWIG